MSLDEDGSHPRSGDEPAHAESPRSEDNADKKSDAPSKNDSGKDAKNGDSKKDAPTKDGDGKESDAKKPRSKKPLIIIGISVLVLAIVGFIVWFWHRNQVSTDDAYTDGNTVTMVPKVSGYVTFLYIDDNVHVRKGQLLVRIDQRDYITAQVQAHAQLTLAIAQVTTAREALKIARVQYPAQLESAKAQQEAAAAALALAQSSYERQHQVDRRATTQDSIDSSTSQQISQAANLKSAKAQVKIASLIPEQVQQAANTVSEREASVQQAQAQLDQAALNLGYTDIRAPSDGFITLRNVQLGSYVVTGQVMFLLVTPDVWITANFKESQIGRMRPGDKVSIEIDAYSGFKLEGHIQSIQYGSGARFSAFPAENATGNFVKIVQRVPVKIVIDRGLDPNRPLPIGLSASPVVYLP